MLLILRDVFYGTAVLAGLGVIYTTLGTLNERLAGGFSLANTAWACCVGVFGIALIGSTITKLFLLARRRRQKPFRANTSGRGWVQDD